MPKTTCCKSTLRGTRNIYDLVYESIYPLYNSLIAIIIRKLYVRKTKMTEILQNNEKLPNHSPATLQNGSGSTHEAYSSASSKKYTLTGLLKSIESEVSSLISSKRQSWVDGDRREGV
jgi:hypothetical protein